MPDDGPIDESWIGPSPTEAPSGSGWKGWLQRRAEAALRKPGRASPAFTEPGECHVVLQLIGARPIPVMAIIAQVTGLDLISARDLAHETPVVLVSGISQSSADRVVGRLEAAGAKAVVGEQYQPH